MEAAFFDLDKTVIAKASLLAFGHTFFKEGLISRVDVVRSLYAQAVYRYLGATEKRLGKIQDVVSSLALGWDQEMVIAIVTNALATIIEPLIYQEALDLMQAHRVAGRKIFLVSASPLEIVRPMADYLKVDGSICSRPAISAEGQYTGEMEFYAYGPYKAEAMRDLAREEGISLPDSYAYSDSYTDAPMLEVVGHAFAVNPDRVLARLAKERSWGILEFKQRTRLSAKKHAGRRKATITTASVVVGAAGVAATAETLRRHHRKINPPMPRSWRPHRD
jgi:HAD superfamily hydrolase (TIGR01490 family)